MESEREGRRGTVRNGNKEHCMKKKVNYRTKDARNVKNVSK